MKKLKRDCNGCFGASFNDCSICDEIRKTPEVKEYITKDEAIQALIDCGEVTGYAFKAAEEAISEIPAEPGVLIKDIYDAGYRGEEIRFYLGGRLFAVRELPQ